MKDTKMIRVPSRGYVTTSRGQVIAPIMSPYRESISCIWSMITVDRATVEEQLPDGTFLKLDVQNFDKDNFVSKEKKEFVKPELQEINPSDNTFKNTDEQQPVPENNSQETPGAVNADDVVEPPVNPENGGQDNSGEENKTEQSENENPEVYAEPETDKVDGDNTPDAHNTDGQQPVPESNSQETPGATVTINGQKRVDPRFNNNKKNKNKNRNNNQNGNNQSVAVTAEPVQ